MPNLFRNDIYSDGLNTNHRGTKAWYLNGQLHRENGPAVIMPSGTPFWCLNGRMLDRYLIHQWYIDNILDSNIDLTEDQQMLFKLKFG